MQLDWILARVIDFSINIDTEMPHKMFNQENCVDDKSGLHCDYATVFM